MADIINFKARAVKKRTNNQTSNNPEKTGEVILFSGVRIQRDEDENNAPQVNKIAQRQESKSQ